MDRRRRKSIKLFSLFFNLEKRHYTSRIIRKIEKRGGTIVTEKNDIVKETKYFFMRIYTIKKIKLIMLS